MGCVSEAQKYQGSLFKGVKDASNKGQQKQDAFLANVQSQVSSASVPTALKNLLEHMLTFENIPRKEKGFRNFVSNSMKVWDAKTQGDLWEVVKAALQKPQNQANGAANGQAKQVPKDAAQEAGKTANGVKDSSSTDATKTKKRSKSENDENEEANVFPGWRESVDAELHKAGGSLPWKKLRTAVVKAYRRLADEKQRVESGEDVQILRVKALAAVPLEYCSETTNLVEIPAK